MMMTAGDKLFMMIREESAKKDGTWSYRFLQDLKMKCKQVHEKQLSKCFTLLIDFVISEESSSLEKYKIAQFMSIMRFQCLVKGFQSFNEKKSQVEKYMAESMPSDPLAVAAKRLLAEIFTSVVEKPNPKIHSYSSQPSYVF